MSIIMFIVLVGSKFHRKASINTWKLQLKPQSHVLGVISGRGRASSTFNFRRSDFVVLYMTWSYVRMRCPLISHGFTFSSFFSSSFDPLIILFFTRYYYFCFPSPFLKSSCWAYLISESLFVLFFFFYNLFHCEYFFVLDSCFLGFLSYAFFFF